MPELPEVEIARRQLERWCCNETIEQIYCDTLFSKKIKNNNRMKDLIGQKVFSVQRYGKRCGIETTKGFLTIHLGMTGKLSLQESTYPRAKIKFSSKTVFLQDTRGFGKIDAETEIGTDILGKDPLLDEIAPEWLQNMLGKKKVKTALLRQDILCGIGNIQAVESLFRAKIHPERNNLTIEEIQKLLLAITESIRYTIEQTTPNEDDNVTYLHESFEKNPFLVYKRAGLPCLLCRQTIQQQRDLGRSTYFCPNCQKVVV